jgi:plastocyanin
MRTTRLLLPFAALVIAAGLLAACGGGSAHSSTSTSKNSAMDGSGGAANGTTITIKNFAFSPSTLTVSPGAKVTVHNDDSATHTVTAVSPHSGAFNTGDIAPGETATFTAPSAPGTYAYICIIHQFMHGTLVVT